MRWCWRADGGGDVLLRPITALSPQWANPPLSTPKAFTLLLFLSRIGKPKGFCPGGEKGERLGRSEDGRRLFQGKGECGKAPWQGPKERGTSLPPSPHRYRSIAGGREENRKSAGWKKEVAKVTGSAWSRRELKGRLKITLAQWEAGGGLGGHGDRLGCGDDWEEGAGGWGQGEQLGWGRLGSREHIWMGEPWVAVGTAGLGATSGWESPGIVMAPAGRGSWGNRWMR